MSRILVTGGSGRLGRSVVAGLAQAGNHITSVDREAVPAGLLPPGVVQETADLLAPGEALRLLREAKPDAVIHLAAIAVPFSAPEDVIFATNTRLAFAVISAATEVGVPKIITASSPTVLGYGSPAGWLPPSFPLDERTPPKPWNAYALSKLIAEQTMQMFATAQGDRIRYAAFRPCFVISPEEWEGAPTQQGHTLAERLADPALSAPALFNYVDARDVADFLDLLLQKMNEIPNGETFFVGAADALATAPLAELMPRFLPGSEALSAGLTGTSPAFSIAKAEELLGWQPRRSWRTELTSRHTLNDEASALVTAGGGSKETP
ncbi:NAD-dependent epimerase/dehydratase family protein [Pseudarthrobacter niigatensis]|uniref:Nucleoside-diphosphate-sugar epimerase n=1 Tax=Pseudarthrobacter niigatensis TaxID=369935 RepID=A0AAJ1SYQ8_9MICC|nr:NAD(P)-dependent oxidoreductase [Pseudarthrobacter niigatensis]MDQ0146192.1 nucleoside-diphosphate-sugar epimerase [Pseudarthrobacter niigatensis]MDQ0266080.1 nucleoside-diphosphate-sugar epimerase [Pseudarthrobacter niigatensis]